MHAREVMTTKLIMVKPEQTRQQVAQLLAQHRISGLPVIDDQNVLIGIVSEYDVLSREGRTVGDIMTEDIISVGPDTDLEDVKHIFIHKNIRRVPVLDHGRLVGIVSRADLVREVATRWVCYVCGETVHSETMPERCPRCDAPGVNIPTEVAPPGS